MSTPMYSTASAGPPPRLGSALSEAIRMLRVAAQRVGAWRTAKKRAAEDREALANMSARQLRDIGISRAVASTLVDTPCVDGYLH